MPGASGEWDPAVQPPRAGMAGRETDFDLKHNSRLLGVHGHWAARLHDPAEPVEQCADERVFALEMIVEIVAGTRVPQVAAHELMPAPGTGPERALGVDPPATATTQLSQGLHRDPPAPRRPIR